MVFLRLVQKLTPLTPVISPCPYLDSFHPPKLKGSLGTGTPILIPIIPDDALSDTILAISPDKTAGANWQKHADEFFKKMKSMGDVRLPGERRHKNRLDKGPRNINEDLVNKIKSLS